MYPKQANSNVRDKSYMWDLLNFKLIKYIVWENVPNFEPTKDSHLYGITFLAIAGNNSVEESKMFSDEIDVMKKVSDGSNPHVLQMIGCVTTTFPMMLLLQFVPNGNLKDYFRSSQFSTSVRGAS